MVQKIKHHSERIAISIINRIKGFTLIELLTIIAILGILAAAVLVAVNPGKRTAQGRDAQRRQDISAIVNALIAYYTIYGKYPAERVCDSSLGSNSSACPTSGDNWNTGPLSSVIFEKLITEDKAFKVNIPKDPINNTTYYYRYEPRNTPTDDFCGTAEPTCDSYWIGARLEAPNDPTKPIYRCSDDPSLTAGTGCKEVGPDSVFTTFPQPTN